MDPCHLSSWPWLVDGLYSVAQAVLLRYIETPLMSPPGSRRGSDFLCSFTSLVRAPHRDFSFRVDVFVLHPVYSEEAYIAASFPPAFGHISSPWRRLFPSYFLLQTIIFPPLSLVILPSNTGHYQKTWLPERVEWGTSHARAIFLTPLEAVWLGYDT